jgi:hypothetical protein
VGKTAQREPGGDTEFVDSLLKSSRLLAPHAGLTRGQIATVVNYERYLQRYSSHSAAPPTKSQLTMVAVAAGLPFIGFGFVDNAIMLTAGEQIDHLVGLRLGITTLASAGLGNLIADVVGVSVTQEIKEKSRRLPWAQPPRLSTLQQAMKVVKGGQGAIFFYFFLSKGHSFY